MLATTPKRQVTTLRTTPTTSFADYMDRMFENLRQEMLTGFFPRGNLWDLDLGGRWLPALTDIEDKGNTYEVRANLPGMKKENIEVRITGRTLQIEAKEATEKEAKGRNYVCHERSYEGFERTFDLPEEVNADKISARYQDGILTVTVPKTNPSPEKKITVS